MSEPTRTHYDVLGISRDADAAAVRAAWKLHVQAWHPDRFTGAMREEAERQAVRINEAYSTLRDQSRRAAYDCRLASEETPRPQSPRATRPAPADFAASNRAAAAPVGSPMVAPAPAAPRTVGEHVAAAGQELAALARRHPRVLVAALSTWVVVLGASATLHVLSAPTMPDGSTVAGTSINASRAAHVDADQAEDLADLAEQARREAEAADAEMARLLEQDEAAARAEAAAEARAAAAAAARAARAPARRARPTGSAGPGTASGRVVRVMPSTS